MTVYRCPTCRFAKSGPGVCWRCGKPLQPGDPTVPPSAPASSFGSGGRPLGADPRGDNKGAGGSLAVRWKWERRSKPLSWRPPEAASTIQIPSQLVHVTSCFNVASIARSGLLTTRAATSGGLSERSSNPDYGLRDAQLQAIYLATTSNPGVSMSENNAAEFQVDLIITLSRDFVLTWCRFNAAVICNDLERVSDCVLCFNDIPPRCISVRMPKRFRFRPTSDPGRPVPITVWKAPPDMLEYQEQERARVVRMREAALRWEREEKERTIRQTLALTPSNRNESPPPAPRPLQLGGAAASLLQRAQEQSSDSESDNEDEWK